MRRDNLNDFLAFIAVAREGSFTKAAAKLGVSQSALSYTVRTLEARLGLRLLTRTTRSVSLTEAGERLLDRIGPRFDEIESEISAISALRDKPAGTVRITSVEHATETILWPAMARLLPEYPDVNVEIISDYTLTDIVAARYDAGVRLGEQVDKDMIAVPIGPDLVRSVVAAPAYFEGRTNPLTPRDLTEHACINLRLPTHGGFFIWDFRKGGQDLDVRVHGRVAFNTVATIRQAALDGMGVAYLPHDLVETDIQRRPPRAPSCGLVPASSRLSSLLPEPPPTLSGIRPCRGCAPLPSMKCLLGSRSRCWRVTDTQPTELLVLTFGAGRRRRHGGSQLVVAQDRGSEQALAHLVDRGPPGEVVAPRGGHLLRRRVVGDRGAVALVALPALAVLHRRAPHAAGKPGGQRGRDGRPAGVLVLVPLGGGAADRAGDAGRAPAGPGELGDAGRHVPVERAGDDGRHGLGVVVHPVGEHAARAVDGAAEHGAALEDDPLGADSGPVVLAIRGGSSSARWVRKVQTSSASIEIARRGLR